VDKKIRCTKCYEEFTEEEVEKANCCPKCGTTGVPHPISQDVTIKISWHELRILCIWASAWMNHAEDFNQDTKETFSAIVGRLMKSRPANAPALTLEEEFRELQDLFPGASLYKGDKVVILPKDVGEA